jgi:hypothetical protein
MAYREDVGAIESGHHGWIRHASVSFRTMLDHLLRELAPDEAVDGYLDDASSYKVGGELRRAARLRYTFREVNVGDGGTNLGSTGGLTSLGSLVSHMRALEGRWISS